MPRRRTNRHHDTEKVITEILKICNYSRQPNWELFNFWSRSTITSALRPFYPKFKSWRFSAYNKPCNRCRHCSKHYPYEDPCRILFVLFTTSSVYLSTSALLYICIRKGLWWTYFTPQIKWEFQINFTISEVQYKNSSLVYLSHTAG